FLLSPEGSHGVSRMVPHLRRRAKAQLPSAGLQPPADVDIVAGRAKLRVESAYRFESLSAEGHIAAGNMLRLVIGQKHMNRAARRIRYTLGDTAIARRRNIRAADAYVIGAPKRAGHVGEPVGIGIRVVVDIGDDLSGRRLPS